jgi:multidrug efflux pump subunit AcrB
MWIVRLALRRPYTFVVAALLVMIVGVFTVLRMPTDIFPNIDIPVISVSFQYGGMPADEMEQRVVGQFERFLTTTVNDIEHIESQSLYGIGVIKIYFQKGANVTNAMSQVTAIAQTAIRQMPPGMQPPLIIQYSASNVPILQLSLGSKTLPEQALFDIAVNQLRPKLITIPGVQIPYPYGGKQRQIMVDLDPDRLYAYGVSPADVSAAINAQSVILPAGTAKVGKQEYQVRLNGSVGTAQALNDLPIKTVDGTTIYVRDVASVRDGFQVQQSKVHADGRTGVLISIMKNGNASTLDVVDNIKRVLPDALAGLPKELEVTPMFDQSVFVRASVDGVVHEAAIAAGLTGLMILLFLGSWRSTVIVVISIPLSILVSIITLSAIGETLNTMTLGGMALAVGILVDDATVAIENIHRNLHMRKRLVTAILDGAQQIAIPTFVATLCICIVFVPVAFVSGAAKYLFTPLAMAVVFAMMTSYVLSRTLVPTMAHYLLAQEVEMYGGVLDPSDPHSVRRRPNPRRRKVIAIAAMTLAAVAAVAVSVFFPAAASSAKAWVTSHPRQLATWVLAAVAAVAALYLISRLNLIWRVHRAFNRGFELVRRFYGGLLTWALGHRVTVIASFLVLVAASCMLAPLIGRDFFPTVDAGQLRLHVRAPAGTRLEETAKYFADVQALIREVIPADEIDVVLDNIGIPNSSINLSLSDMSLIGPSDGEIMVSLKKHHAPSAGYQQTLRRELARRFPQLVCYFAPSDIATQVLNFGLPASIDIQVAGSMANAAKHQQIAAAIANDVRKIPGAADIRMQQVTHNPDLRINVDRTQADQMGLSQREVASDLLVSLSGSGQTAPNFWLNPRNGVNYQILVQTPQYRVGSLADLENTPVVPAGARSQQETQLLSNLATLGRGTTPTNATHYNISPTYDVLMGVAGTDLASVAKAVQAVVDKYTPDLPAGSKIALRGQVESMQSSFAGLAGGLVFAVVLVYLLMVVNFQSWLDPFIILMALPGALAGILWMLFVTGTTVSVPALMGAIMSIGVATANSILLITFANDQRLLGKGSTDAALAAGITRLRPVVMTALAMIIGMLPMSLGLGEGGEQNAPLGRAVIGGLTVATFTTLFLVPVVYSLLRAAPPQTQVEEELR